MQQYDCTHWEHSTLYTHSQHSHSAPLAVLILHAKISGSTHWPLECQASCLPPAPTIRHIHRVGQIRISIIILYGTVYTYICRIIQGGGRPYPYSVFSVSNMDRYHTAYVRRIYAAFHIPLHTVLLYKKKVAKPV